MFYELSINLFLNSLIVIFSWNKEEDVLVMPLKWVNSFPHVWFAIN